MCLDLPIWLYISLGLVGLPAISFLVLLISIITMARMLILFCALIGSVLTAKSVTYPGIGTFNSNDFVDALHRPFTDLFLPQSPAHIDPQFRLYTRKNHDNADTLIWNSTESIGHSHFDGHKQTKVIVHGFIDNQLFGEWMHKLKNAILAHEDVNVITVDWHKGNFFPYGQATVNTRVVGAMIGIQIQALSHAKQTTPAAFHIMGHSLGSHIAGYAGKFLHGALGRITGLDPAGPFFEGLPPAARLWHTDAHFVDSIHTDARPLIEVGFGMYETCSHVDIYPNGGKVQPGCHQERLTSAIFKGVLEGARRLVACNHQRAVDLIIESYNAHNPLPKAYECHSFDEFKAGNCNACGTHGEKCAILGERNIDYKQSVADVNQGENTVNGKRFFMVTSAHEPLINKYQYIVRVHMAAHGLEQFDKISKIHIKFVDKKGHSEDFQINDESLLQTIFKLGQSYTYTGVMATDPADLLKIDFEWDNGLLVVDPLHLFKMNVANVEVMGLNTHLSTTKSAPTVLKYCNTSGAIVSKKHVSFAHC